jgi:hypothetical protein
MTQFRLFLVKFTLLLAVIALIVGGTLVLIRPDPAGYFQASLYKLDILKRTPSPRLIVIGGSNVAFGVDSELLESELGIPVVNMGLHVGLGESSYKELNNYIRPGDIILLMPEYSIFRNDDILNGNDLALSQWSEYDLARLRLVDPVRVPTLILTMVQVKATRQLSSMLGKGDLERGVYTSGEFNSHGDFIGQVSAVEPIKNLGREAYILPGEFNLNTYLFLEQFNRDAKSKGALVFLEFPASRGLNCIVTGEQQFQKLYDNLKKLTSIPVITDMQELCYPNSYFYDNIQHLNGVGREVMTMRIIRDILPYLSK